MGKIRVMIVDDAVVIRRLVTDAISADPDIEVVGTASNGRIAIQKLTQLQPDVITMDVEMPEMDGLQAVTEIRKTHPKIPIIMFSTLTERGGQATLEALARGATDYVTKPANVGSISEGIARCRDELVPKIKWLSGRISTRPESAPRIGNASRIGNAPSGRMPVAGPGPVAISNTVRKPRPVGPPGIDAIAIGVSTGGPVAIGKVFPMFPADLAVPIFVVQHMPPVFTRLLADRLATTCKVKVCEGEPGMKVVPGTIYIAPGGFHMTVKRVGNVVEIGTNSLPHECSCRPAVDHLFRSVSQVYGHRLAAAVLTGMGHDGMRGAEVIRDAGGDVIAQDEQSSVVWGMPGAVVNAQLADEVLPIERIAESLVRRARAGRSVASLSVA